ncbi:flavin monoamine oxidase family protein [Bdellovibrio bacteriovorus]|uniref:flavin monoamine oxidase family protein n=1 Tax=Bdellovibrio TaxID=958 RepID=UPI0035A8A96F
MQYDVIIVGAGAAGLSCARTLIQGGARCLLLEARDRMGGRISSVSTSPSSMIELGAEFIHGASPETLGLLERHDFSFEDLTDHHLQKTKTGLSDVSSFWERVGKINSLLRSDLTQDRSMQNFIDAHKRKISPFKDLYISYLEGFQAMDLRLAGELGMAESENKQVQKLNSQSQFRPLPGYINVIEALFKESGLKKNQIHFNREVQKIALRKKSLDVIAVHPKTHRKIKYSTSRVVLTVPIGVLKRSLVFEPAIPRLKKTLSVMEMGHALRITFQFKTRFWEKLSTKPVAFLHGDSDDYFSTWWTQLPRRSPYLTAWQGGPKALELSFMSEQEQVSWALKTLSKITGEKLSALKKNYVKHFTHNWSQDPYSLGAYSYVGIQKETSWEKLKQPFHDAIYLAGEGLASGADRGTVTGAIKSGHQVALKVLKGL